MEKFHPFRSFGCLIAECPGCLLISSLLIALCSVGIYKLDLRDNVREGWTPTTSRAQAETNILKEFFNSTADPMRVVVVLQARDNGSMHRLEYLEATVRFYEHVTQHMEVADPEFGNSNFNYHKICSPFCNDNIPIVFFKQTLFAYYYNYNALFKPGKQASLQPKLTYPIATVDNQLLHLQPNFYGVRLYSQQADGDGVVGDDDAEMDVMKEVCDIAYVKAIMMTFRANLHGWHSEQRAIQWEIALYQHTNTHFRGPEDNKIDAYVLGDAVVNHEVMEDGKKRTGPVLALGLVLMFIFITIAVALESAYVGVFCCTKLAIPLCALLCPFLAVSTTLGIWSLASLRTNSAMLIMPLLILGIGVDDAFLLLHAWIGTAQKGLTPKARIVHIVSEMGPAMSITTVTNVLTFAVGIFTPTIEIRLFCASGAIALTFTFLYTFGIFVPFLYYLSGCEQADTNELDIPKPRIELQPKMLNRLALWLLDGYCQLLKRWYFCAVLFSIYSIYIACSAYGAFTIRAKLDTDEILPHDSPLREPNRIISSLVWNEYYPVTIFINKPLDITNAEQLARFNAMLTEFEALDKCKGSNFTVAWIRDYESFSQLNQRHRFALEWLNNDDLDFCFSLESHMRPSDTELDYKIFADFLSSRLYSHYVPYLKFSGRESECARVPVSSFVLLVSFEKTRDWQQRIALTQQWRAVVDKYADLNASVWDVNGMFVDQMLSLKRLTIESTFYTLFFMALVCLVFICNPILVVAAVWAIASICVGVVGLLALLFGMDLNPITLCTILMCIGMSVDFTAHTCYHFQLCTRHKATRPGIVVELPLRTTEEKLRNCIKSIAWPMMLAGISTTLAVIPLAFLNNYIPLAFFKTIVLVVLCGILHGLVLLPAILSKLPNSWLEIFFFPCCKRSSSSSTQMPSNSNVINLAEFNAFLNDVEPIPSVVN